MRDNRGSWRCAGRRDRRVEMRLFPWDSSTTFVPFQLRTYAAAKPHDCRCLSSRDTIAGIAFGSSQFGLQLTLAHIGRAERGEVKRREDDLQVVGCSFIQPLSGRLQIVIPVISSHVNGGNDMRAQEPLGG